MMATILEWLDIIYDGVGFEAVGGQELLDGSVEKEHSREFSTQQFVQDVAVDVGQTEISAGDSVGEAFVVEAEQV